MKTKSIIVTLVFAIAFSAFGENGKKEELAFIKENTLFAQQQLSLMIKTLPDPDTAGIVPCSTLNVP